MLKNIVNRFAFIVFTFTCSVCLSSELSDLVSKLQKLEGKEKIQASVHIENQTSTKGEKNSRKVESDFVINAEDQNISITYLGDISKVTAGSDTGTSTFTGEVTETTNLQDFSVFRAIELTNYGASLARELKSLKLVKKSTDKYQDIPCTLLTLNSKETQKTSGVKATTKRNVKIWLDNEGYPVAGSFETDVSARIMLVIKISTDSSRRQSYERLEDRLILTLDKNETDIKTEEGDLKQILTTIVEAKKD